MEKMHLSPKESFNESHILGEEDNQIDCSPFKHFKYTEPNYTTFIHAHEFLQE